MYKYSMYKPASIPNRWNAGDQADLIRGGWRLAWLGIHGGLRPQGPGRPQGHGPVVGAAGDVGGGVGPLHFLLHGPSGRHLDVETHNYCEKVEEAEVGVHYLLFFLYFCALIPVI